MFKQVRKIIASVWNRLFSRRSVIKNASPNDSRPSSTFDHGGEHVVVGSLRTEKVESSYNTLRAQRVLPKVSKVELINKPRVTALEATEYFNGMKKTIVNNGIKADVFIEMCDEMVSGCCEIANSDFTLAAVVYDILFPPLSCSGVYLKCFWVSAY